MSVIELFERLRVAAAVDPKQMPDDRLAAEGEAAPEAEVMPDGEALIGLFQTFRPDGRRLEGLLEDLPAGTELERRLGRLFADAGDDRRPQGGRDAYFIVRRPSPIDPDRVEALAREWLTNLRELAEELGERPVAEVLSPLPRIRVLEGIPPKHPKRPEDQSPLLIAMDRSAPRLVERIEPPCPYAELLRQAYYFISCDPMLRDYLMWPLYGGTVSVDDPHGPYYELWKHGVKYRIFQAAQVDFYLPRQASFSS